MLNIYSEIVWFEDLTIKQGYHNQYINVNVLTKSANDIK